MTEAQLLDGQAFNRLVLENDLAGKTWEQNGYIYAGFRGQNGYELYRAYGPKIKFLYQSRRLATNANAAGNPIIIDISIPAATVARLVVLQGVQATTGTHTLLAYQQDEDQSGYVYLANIATAAGTNFGIPSIGANASATANNINSLGLLIGPGGTLSINTGGNSGVANDTLAVYIVLLMSTNTEPTWSYARSTNAANITLGANTISTPMTPVLMP